MGNSDIEKKLKREAQTHVPDPREKILTAARAEGILPSAERPTKRKATRVWAWSAFAAAAVAVVLCLCILLPSKHNVGGGDTTTYKPVVLGTMDAYGFGAVSSARLLHTSGYGGVRTVSAYAASPAIPAQTSLRTFHSYFTAMDGFLGEGIVHTTVEDADGGAYAFVMTVRGKDADGNDTVYAMYYDETPTSEEDDDGETEREYMLRGSMTLDGYTYALEGERSYAAEDDETEEELEIRAYRDIADRKTYVRMKQERSAEHGETEIEYVYSLVVDGKTVSEAAVEFESEQKKGKTKTEYVYEFRNGAARGKYTLKSDDNASSMTVRYEENGEKGQFRIRRTPDGYVYRFADESEITM